MIFGIKEKWIILTQTMLAIATNIPVLLKAGFVVQDLKCHLKPQCTSLLMCSSVAGVWVWCRWGWSGVWSSAVLSVSSASVHLSESQHTPALTSGHSAPAGAAFSTGVCLCTFTCCAIYAKTGFIISQTEDVYEDMHLWNNVVQKWPHKKV